MTKETKETKEIIKQFKKDFPDYRKEKTGTLTIPIDKMMKMQDSIINVMKKESRNCAKYLMKGYIYD